MASRKEYELLFSLKATLDGSYKSNFNSAQSSIAGLQKELQSIKSVQNDVSAYQKQESALEASRKKVEELQAEYRRLQNEERIMGEVSTDLAARYSKNEKQFWQASMAVEDNEKKLDKLGGELREAGVDTNNLTAENKRLEVSYSDIKGEQEQMAASLGDDSSGLIAGAAKFTAGLAAVAAAAKAVYSVLGPMIETAAEFESQMSTVEAISGATAEEMEQLSAAAKKMGAATKFTAVEAGEALEYMAMAGWDAEEMISGLPGVMNLAAASGEDLAQTSDIVTDAMTAFGMAADQSNRFADVLAQTATSANTNVGIMGETFKNVAPLAGAMGYSIEDMSTAIGIMANSGIKGSKAGTSLKNVITNLASPTSDVTAAMESLGVSLTDDSGEALAFKDVVNNLRTAFSKLSKTQKAAYASTIAGKQGMAGLLALVNSTADEYDALTEAIENCGGAAEKMAEIRLDNYKGQVTLLESAWEGLSTTIGEKFLPVMTAGASGLTDLVTGLNDWIIGEEELSASFAETAQSLQDSLSTAALYEEYRTLQSVLSDTTATADEQAAAEERLTVVKNLLTEASGGLITASMAQEEQWWREAEALEYLNEQTIRAKGEEVYKALLDGSEKFVDAVKSEDALIASRDKALAARDDAFNADQIKEEYAAQEELIGAYKELQSLSQQTGADGISFFDTVEGSKQLSAGLSEVSTLYNDIFGTDYKFSTFQQMADELDDMVLSSSDWLEIMQAANGDIEKAEGYLTKNGDTQAEYIENLASAIQSGYISYEKAEEIFEDGFAGAENRAELVAESMAKVDAAIEKADSAAAGAAEKFEELTLSEEELAEAQRLLKTATKAVESGYLTAEQAADHYGVSINEITGLQEENAAQTKLLEQGVAGVEGGFWSLSEAAEILGVDIRDLQKAQQEYKDSIGDVGAYQRAIDFLDQFQDAYAGVREAAVEAIQDQISLTTEMSSKSETSTAEMIANLQSQKVFYDTYAQNLQKALDMGLNADLFADFNSNISEENGQLLNELVKSETALQKVNAAYEDTQASAANLGETQVALDLAGYLDDALTEALGISEEGGAEIVKVIAQAMQDEGGTLDKASVKVITNALVEGGVITEDEAPSVGEHLTKGMAEGVLDKEGDLYDAVRKVVSESIAVAKVTAAEGVAAMAVSSASTSGGIRMSISEYASGTSSAARGMALVGENGPELVNFGGGEFVYTAGETRKMATAPNLNLSRGLGGTIKLDVQNSPVIYVNGDVPGDLENKLAQNNESLIAQIQEMLASNAANERRVSYD